MSLDEFPYHPPLYYLPTFSLLELLQGEVRRTKANPRGGSIGWMGGESMINPIYPIFHFMYQFDCQFDFPL